MLLRAKIRSGEEDLSVFESQLLEDNGLQRAHSSPTLQDSSQASLASSTRDGGNSSKASGCSSKQRQEGQRHSYRQAVKKWDEAGAPGAARRCTASGRLSPCRGFVWSSAWRGEQEWGSNPRLPPKHEALPGTPIFSSNRGGADPVTGRQASAGGGRERWEVTDLQTRCLWERMLGAAADCEAERLLTDRTGQRTGTYIQHPFLFSSPFVLSRHLRPRSHTFFLDLTLRFLGPNMFTHTLNCHHIIDDWWFDFCWISAAALEVKRCNNN